MRSSTSLPLFLLLGVIHSVTAVIFPFHARTRNPPRARGHFHRRADVTGVPVTDQGDVRYLTNITLGGNQFQVTIDTGSSDLWVTGSVPGTVDSGKPLSIPYAVGQASGNVNFATLGFDNYTVESQAYILATNTSGQDLDGVQGLIGLGPNTGSFIHRLIGNESADSPLSRIFALNRTTQNFLSFQLSRDNETVDPITGQLTISEVIPGFENITSQPKLPVRNMLTSAIAKIGLDQHWGVLIDANGIIGPDGNPIASSSIVSGVPKGQLVAIFDTGFTLAQVPRSMSDAIYGRVRGAVYDTTDEFWTVPCDQELNLTFKFGGQSYPIHPADVSAVNTGAANQSPCIGIFQPATTSFDVAGEYDLILGMPFLRNVYTLIDFGDFVTDSSNDRGDPFIQLLSVTDPAKAHQDFVNSRLGGVDTTNSPSQALLPASQESHSPETATEKKLHNLGFVLRHLPAFIAGFIVLALLFIGCCVWACCRRRRRLRQGTTTPGLSMRSTHQYQNLQAPAPPAMQMHPLDVDAGYYDPYAPPS